MFVYGVSLSDIHSVVRDVSGALYDGNITVRTGEDRSNRAGPRATFTLGATNTAVVAPREAPPRLARAPARTAGAAPFPRAGTPTAAG